MYRSRFVLVASLMLLGLAALAGVALIPSFVSVLSTENPAALSEAAQAKQNSAYELDYTQSLMSELGPRLTATTSALTIAISALELKPAGLRVNRITYIPGEEESRITFLGNASREQVSSYRDALLQSGAFTGVAVPVGALVGSNDGNFSIVMTGNF